MHHLDWTQNLTCSNWDLDLVNSDLVPPLKYSGRQEEAYERQRHWLLWTYSMFYVWSSSPQQETKLCKYVPFVSIIHLSLSLIPPYPHLACQLHTTPALKKWFILLSEKWEQESKLRAREWAAGRGNISKAQYISVFVTYYLVAIFLHFLKITSIVLPRQAPDAHKRL